VAGTDVTSPSGQAPAADLPQRVSLLLTYYLARDVTLAAAGIALLTAVVAGALAVEGFAEHATVEA